MTRDYSKFMLQPGAAKPAVHKPSRLVTLGWQPFFTRQTSIDGLAETPPVRMVEVHRIGLQTLGDGIDQLIPPEPEAAVADWLLRNQQYPPESIVLNRKSLFKNRAAKRIAGCN
ncbi:hypothetical protein [Phaeobacter sp. C3_T13_0]|uniref:hypothetical protein n=1 Tax=Phaeobacter cretensis TaxID=3342641 RepID=UPI0039BC929A